MSKDNIAIYGLGSLGKKIFEYNQRDNLYNIIGFVDDNLNSDPDLYPPINL